MKWFRIKRKGILVCCVAIGFVTLLYEAIAFNALESANGVQLINCKRDLSDEQQDYIRQESSPLFDNRDSITSYSDIEARKVQQELSGFDSVHLDLVVNKTIINTVHYVWCGNTTFEFINYLSVISAWKVLQPDIIELHSEHPPMTDKYNDWINVIQSTIPAFVVRPMPKNWDGMENGCGFWFGLAVIDDRGGIYIGNDVLIGTMAPKLLTEELSLYFTEYATGKLEVAMAMTKEHIPALRVFRQQFKQNKPGLKKPPMCKMLHLTNNSFDQSSPCYIVNDIVYPKDIFELNSQFGNYLRSIIYGYPDIKIAKPVLPGKISKLIHYVWFGKKEMDFLMYLSMLSTLFILKADKVVIYTDGYLKGPYFDKIKTDRRVMIVKRERPTSIFGKKVLYTQHRSDIVRAEVLLKYGGIYMDWDVLWLRNPDDLIDKGYDAVANFDHMPHHPFPDCINLGVLMAKPKSTFIKRWQDALFNYRSNDFLYNAVDLPYKIYERFPEHLHIERHLQVMCFHLKCHPTFKQDFKNHNQEQPFDWRKDAYSIHFTYPDPPELTNETACIKGTGRFAEIGQYILKHSNKLNAS